LFIVAPPTNETRWHQWTVGAIYYSVLVLAEALGKSNTSQIVDLTGAIGSEFTPAYAVYENSQLSKVALFNYVDDLAGTRGPSDLKVALNVPGGVPGSVKVKYLDAKSVSSKFNITWAGQVSLCLVFPVLGYIEFDLMFCCRLLVTNSKLMDV
jgi:hypothetical protein